MWLDKQWHSCKLACLLITDTPGAEMHYLQCSLFKHFFSYSFTAGVCETCMTTTVLAWLHLLVALPVGLLIAGQKVYTLVARNIAFTKKINKKKLLQKMLILKCTQLIALPVKSGVYQRFTIKSFVAQSLKIVCNVSR